MKMIVTYLDSLEWGRQHRRHLCEFLFTERTNHGASYHLDDAQVTLPSGSRLSVIAEHNPENRSFGLQARIDGEIIVSVSTEFGWLPFILEARFTKDIALGFIVPVEPRAE